MGCADSTRGISWLFATRVNSLDCLCLRRHARSIVLKLLERCPDMRILILGGYGVFGGRLAQLLSGTPEMTLLIAGRNAKKAAAFCAAFEGTTEPVTLDRVDIAKGLAEWRPDVVVDASGPFQDYGAARYVVVEACIAARVHYLDFADAADFVFGIDQFDTAATAAGVFVLSGVSSFPVLTAAVVREMAQQMDVRSVTGGIAPSPYAGIGLNVMRAVVGYAGGPIKLLRDGQQVEAKGLTESLRYTVAVPGRMPLRNLRFSLVDVPDLQVIPPAHAGLRDIWMGAGPVPEILHRMLNVLAKVRARFRLPAMTPLSPLFYWVLNLMTFGEHRGGMFVRGQGVRDGQPFEMSWHLLAEGDDGPFIPSMAIEVILRKMLTGKAPAPGARAATDALSLGDYDTAFRSRTIYTGWRSNDDAGPLYRRVLGNDYDALPPQVRALHDVDRVRIWRGEAAVRRGTGKLAQLVARVFGFPPAGDGLPVSVTLTPDRGGEHWQRDFGGARFRSRQTLGTGRNDRLLVESFGPIRVALAIIREGDRLYLVPRRWSLWRLPLPKVFLPKGTSFETEEAGRFRFDVEIAAPVIGLIVGYRGWLEAG